MPDLALSLHPLDLPLVHPFTIARGTETVARSVIFRLQWDGVEGIGESSPTERYDESVETVIAHFRDHELSGNDPYLLDDLLAGMPPAARCGLDLALHDLIAKLCDLPLYRLLGLNPAHTPRTSFTIGIGELAPTLRKVEDLLDHPILKIKLGSASGEDEIALIEAIRSRYRGTIRIDANEGWTAQRAVATLRELARFDIEFCEQPIPAGSPEQLRYVRERSPIAIVTDEDSCNAEDLPRLHGCVDGINVKLVKCGGIRAALRMIHTARALGMKIMLGCMVESQVLTSAAAHLSPLVDWADLDGPFLTRNDPFTGITYDRGTIVLPDGPGLGVRERSAVG